jgi:chemotaxis protein MotA
MVAPNAFPSRSQAPGGAPLAIATPKSSLRPDFATLLGIVVALAGIVGGLLLEKGQLSDILQGTAALIVFGGTLGAVLVTTPWNVVVRACRSLARVFFEPSTDATSIIESLIQYATKARRNGIVSLETDTPAIEDPFLQKALNLAVDGTDMQELRAMMELDLDMAEQAGEAEARVWESAGGYAPTIGIIGAVMGLIQVMKDLNDIPKVGHGIAVAFVATIYGVGSANLVLLPAASKLRARLRQTLDTKEMILTGVCGIVEGMNSGLIRIKMRSFCEQAAILAPPRPPAAKPAPKPGRSALRPPPLKPGGGSL